MASAHVTHRHLRQTLGSGLWLVGAAYLVAALVGLPLFADGAYYYLKLAVDGDLLLPNLRVTAVLPQLPAWIAVRWGLDAVAVRHAFAIGYQALPWLSLLACWLIVRRRQPALLVFPLLGALANLINFSAVSELLSSLYLTWPLALAMALAPQRTWVRWYALAAGPLLLGLHPMAFVPAAALAAGAGIIAWQVPMQRGPWRRLGLWLALFAALRLLWTIVGANAYERGNLTPGGMAWYLLTETWGQHLLLATVVLAAVLGAWVLWRRAQGAAAAVATTLFTTCCLLALAAALATAVEFLLGDGIKLKAALVFVAQLGLMALAFACIRLTSPDTTTPGADSSATLPTGPMRWLLAAMLVLILAKSAAWWTATRNLQTVIAATDAHCIAFGPEIPYGLQWPWMQVIDDWATPMHALAFRPRVPTAAGVAPVALLLPDDGCAVLARTGAVNLTSWLTRDFATLDAVFGPLRRPRADAAVSPVDAALATGNRSLLLPLREEIADELLQPRRLGAEHTVAGGRRKRPGEGLTVGAARRSDLREACLQWCIGGEDGGEPGLRNLDEADVAGCSGGGVTRLAGEHGALAEALPGAQTLDFFHLALDAPAQDHDTGGDDEHGVARLTLLDNALPRTDLLRHESVGQRRDLVVRQRREDSDVAQYLRHARQ